MDFDQDYVEQLTAHYSPISASLLFGAVHRVRWTLSQALEARNQWSDDGSHTVAWITAPARLGGEPLDALVAFTDETALVTLDTAGEGHTQRSGIDPDLVGTFARRQKSGSDALFTRSERDLSLRGASAVAPAGWLVSGGAEVGVVEVILGLEFGAKAKKFPRGARVVRVGGRHLAGVGLARVTLGTERWAPVDLSGIGAAIDRVGAIWKMDVQPFLLVAPEPVVVAEGTPAAARRLG